MKKKKWTLAYIALNILIIVSIAIFDPEIKDIGSAFKEVQPFWILGALGAMVMYWLIDGALICYTSKVIHEESNFWGCFKIALIGHYYSAVTPFSSGGQPAQIYYMGKLGIPGGAASSILIVKFLVYQVVISLYSTAAFIWKGAYIYDYNPWLFWFSVIGFVINAGGLFLLVFLSLNKGFVRGLLFKIIDLISKTRLIKDPDRVKDRLKSHIEDFHSGMKLVQGNFRALINMAILTALQLGFLFSITFLIYRALGLEGDKWITIVFMQSLLYLAVSFVPTPGSTGASETGFMAFFRIFFPGNLLFVSMLLWRIISYYLNILAGLVIILYDSIRQIWARDIAN